MAFLSFLSSCPKATETFGRRLGQVLRPGDVVSLAAEMGAGKTVLAAGVVRSLMGEDIDVSSPTFTIIHDYPGSPPVKHADLYRLAEPDEILELGLFDDDAAIVLVEWAEKGAAFLPPGYLEVGIHLVPEGRMIALSGDREWQERLTGRGIDEPCS
ncbi:hypothetical protein PB2503_03057 [Parvularcula bermudensis HTCC2503]|uniref:tRNA threonylcarbamoyladenosine biosynthesis protein TsaE n=1 Tax=Parvularcula bermudensis (strain ATCC BAA-594 / HTCC2503 / KCTC 12087) TaxID=314260 RepID=E0TD29_PARBH|nr:tRNA (adenosine(37)-N6)-threonylcarbamoyltransferase complex ATPase subunit type 1 TsaE [Parvularcula bermudensis]ADM08688.1 hypothetical protein PB2503_03057 [Parvularcula bermudensis HTCC2503]